MIELSRFVFLVKEHLFFFFLRDQQHRENAGRSIMHLVKSLVKSTSKGLALSVKKWPLRFLKSV
jgi:hypothetical protein